MIRVEEITNPGPDVTALVADCECEAVDPGECSCPHAVWFLRANKDDEDE